MTTSLERSRTYPVEVGPAFDEVLSMPLEQVFRRRFGPLPPVRGTDLHDGGPWGRVGQTRTIRLGDGGTLRETLTEVDRPHAFGYRIDTITGPMSPLFAGLDGSWTFAPVRSGCRITWRWTVRPRNRWAAGALPVFARLWHGYARQALEEIEDALVAT